MKTIAAVTALALCPLAVQDPPPPAPVLEQHQWLQQLVGEWDATSSFTMDPGGEPMTMQITETVRAIGGLWVVGEGRMEMGGQPMQSVLTLGYDPKRGKFVGTWIDSVHAHLWLYTGSLDETGKILTLDTQGPSFDDPEKTSRYRDAIQIVDGNRRVLTSSVQGADGQWVSFLRAEYRRKTDK